MSLSCSKPKQPTKRDKRTSLESTWMRSGGQQGATSTEAMPTLSVDLAFKDARDTGVVPLHKIDGRINASAVPLVTRGLRGRPTIAALADTLVELANDVGARWIFIDGPQGWKAPDNGFEHCRCCERLLATPGKTGLPGACKPGNYVGFITFAIELFDALDGKGWPRLLTSNI